PRPPARGRRGLPRRGRRALRRAYPADRLPAPVRVDRPAARGPRADSHPHHRGRGGGRLAGAAVRRGGTGRTPGHARQAAPAALALRPRRLPQGHRSHRRHPRERAARQRRQRMSFHDAAIDGACRAPATRAVRAGIDRDEAFGAVTPPLVLSSNFSFAGFNDKRQYDYTRSGNPTRDLLGEALAELEGGAGGTITATG